MIRADSFMGWQPIPGVYSPPALHPNIWFGDFILDGHALSMAGRLIGREGKNLKRITHEAGAHYIFLRQDRGCVEVWGSYESIGTAFGLLQGLVDGLPRPNHIVSFTDGAVLTDADLEHVARESGCDRIDRGGDGLLRISGSREAIGIATALLRRLVEIRSWQPVPGVYSPPALVPNIWFGDFILPDHDLPGIEDRLEQITATAGAHYVFSRPDRGCIEVWGSYESIGEAFRMIRELVEAGTADKVFDPDPSFSADLRTLVKMTKTRRRRRPRPLETDETGKAWKAFLATKKIT